MALLSNVALPSDIQNFHISNREGVPDSTILIFTCRKNAKVYTYMFGISDLEYANFTVAFSNTITYANGSNYVESVQAYNGIVSELQESKTFMFNQLLNWRFQQTSNLITLNIEAIDSNGNTNVYTFYLDRRVVNMADAQTIIQDITNIPETMVYSTTVSPIAVLPSGSVDLLFAVGSGGYNNILVNVASSTIYEGFRVAVNAVNSQLQQEVIPPTIPPTYVLVQTASGVSPRNIRDLAKSGDTLSSLSCSLGKNNMAVIVVTGVVAINSTLRYVINIYMDRSQIYELNSELQAVPFPV